MYIGPEYTKEYINSYSDNVKYENHYVERKRYGDIDIKKLDDVTKLIFSDEQIFL